MYARLSSAYRPSTSRYGTRSRRLDRYMARSRVTFSRSGFSSLLKYGPPRQKRTCQERDETFIRHQRGRAAKPEPKPEERERDKTPPAKPEEIEKELHVKSIDLHIDKNTKRHHTNKYKVTKKRKNAKGEQLDPELVIRRGQSFKISIHLDREYDKAVHDLKLLFRIGLDQDQMPTKGTAVQIKLDESDRGSRNSGKDWYAHLKKIKDKSIDIEVYTPPNCIIGAWDLGILTRTDLKNAPDKLFRYDHPDDVYILLNPWCTDDGVYMVPEKLLDEYVLNDSGVVFQGNDHQISAKAWNFAQFEEDILDICLHVVRKAFNGKIGRGMACPIRLSRAISQTVNSSDEGGILTGRWDGDYSGGCTPTSWCGSEKILRKYDNTKEPVRYGQCWVFSALTTTLCRAIGLPCRSVTNFSSAHDTDGSFTIDSTGYKDPKTGDFEIIPERSEDSVWNFHVWNDVWMARPDLTGYDGWQAIDATPQERSGGLMCCGPSPLKAIKNGDTNIPYDTGFIFAEVNADKIMWEIKDDYDCEIYSIDKRSVGKRMSTKKPNGYPMLGSPSVYMSNNLDEDNIMHMYKNSEGTIEERRAVEHAYKFTSSEIIPMTYLDKEPDVRCFFEEKDGIMVGSEFSATLHLKSRLSSKATAVAMITIKTVNNNGYVVNVVKRLKFNDVEILPGQETSLEMPISVDEYLVHLSEHASMRMYGWVICPPALDTYTCEVNFRLRRPDLTVKYVRECKVNKKVDIELSFKNPLSMKLTTCSLNIEGCGIEDVIEQKDVGPKGEWSFKLTVIPDVPGCKQISADFECDQIPDISGVAVLEVTE